MKAGAELQGGEGRASAAGQSWLIPAFTGFSNRFCKGMPPDRWMNRQAVHENPWNMRARGFADAEVGSWLIAAGVSGH